MTAARALASAVTAAALCAAAMWLWSRQPDLEANSMNPLRTYGRIGAVVTNDAFSVRIDRYDVAASITTTSLSNGAHVADGLFVVVHFHARAERRPYKMKYVRLETRDGRTYNEGGRVGVLTRADGTYQPMLWGSGTLVFEVPEDRLAGASVVIGQTYGPAVSDLTAESVIDLGIDDAKAARLSTRPAANYHLGDRS
ncbi:MAG TPA: hypothetical protein VE465_17925 [Streptosporangiaceae bacterium]|jgi:hypothetical protein|nr:hypothetical protein [Streptosporangiaceae bacterium]